MARKVVGVLLVLAGVAGAVFAFLIHSAIGENQRVIEHNMGRLREVVPEHFEIGDGAEGLLAFLQSDYMQVIAATDLRQYEEVLDISTVVAEQEGYIAERERWRLIYAGAGGALLLIGLVLLLGGGKRRAVAGAAAAA